MELRQLMRCGLQEVDQQASKNLGGHRDTGN